MGAVYLGHDGDRERDVFTKVLSGALAHDEAIRARFTNEGKLLLGLQHPNIVEVIEHDDRTSAILAGNFRPLVQSP